MEIWLTPLLALVGIAVSSFVTYKIATRNKSGTIATSEAADLWAESNKLRQEYKDRAEKLEAQLIEVNNKLDLMTTELNKLRNNSDTQLRKIEELKTLITQLRDENKRLLELKKEAAA